MPEQRSERTGTDDESRVDYLLNLLSDLTQRDPSPALRERLGALAAQRLRDTAQLRGASHRPSVWLKPAFAAVLAAAIAISAAVAIHFRQHEPGQTDRTAGASHPAISRENTAHVAPAVRASVTRSPWVHRPQPVLTQAASTRRMTMLLPYSNSAIETGTDTTIRVSMSQSELLSLGFPINATVQDRRVAAELTLGDDGLPRAISLPLPIEVMKEKK